MTKKNEMLLRTLFGLPLGAIAGIVTGVLIHPLVGVLAFVVLFFVSGWGFLKLAMKYAGKQYDRYGELREEVKQEAGLRLDGLANYESAAGQLYLGRLFLTDADLRFVGKTKGGEETKFQLLLSEIALATDYKPSEYVSTGLQLRMRNGRVYRFVVEVPGEWIDRIREGN